MTPEIPAQRLLRWCNSRHYYDGIQCPWSGYGDIDYAPVERVLATAAAPVSYDQLIDAGVPEALLRHTVLIDVSPVPEFYVSPCDAPASPYLVEAVEQRNRVLLRRFPSGELWSALSRPPREAALLYYRRRGDDGGAWRRLDLVRTPDPRYPADLQRDAAVWAELTSDKGTLEVRAIVVDADHPPVTVSDDRNEDLNELVRRQRHPLVEEGHLVFAA